MLYVRFSEVPSRVKKLDQMAKKMGMNRSAFIRHTMRKRVDNQ